MRAFLLSIGLFALGLWMLLISLRCFNTLLRGDIRSTRSTQWGYNSATENKIATGFGGVIYGVWAAIALGMGRFVAGREFVVPLVIGLLVFIAIGAGLRSYYKITTR